MVEYLIFITLIMILFGLARVCMLLIDLIDLVKLMMCEEDEPEPSSDLPCFPHRIHDN